MKPPPGAGKRVYPHGRMGTGTDPKPTAADNDITEQLARAAELLGDMGIAAETLGTTLGTTQIVPEFSLVRDDLDDDARWQAEEDAAAELIARETSAPRIVEPDSIDSTDLAARDRPSAAEAHAADLDYLSAVSSHKRAEIETLRKLDASLDRELELISEVERLESSIATMARSLSRFEAERRAWASKLAEAQRPRQHRLVSSLLTLLRGDR